MRKTTLAAALTFLLLAPFGAHAAENEFEAVYEEAANLHQQAGEHKWTTTRDLLAAARREAKEGNYDEALSLSREARVLAEQSVEQAEDQEAAWKNAVVD